MPLLTAPPATSLGTSAIPSPPLPAPVAHFDIGGPLSDLVIPPADGNVLLPGDPGFHNLLPFNLRTTTPPMAIVQCRDAHAASLAVQWARRHQIALCAHSGGHSYEGYCSGAGLMVDVRQINGVTIDASSQTARVGAGCLLGDLATALFAQNFALPAGSCRPVGVAGLALGGGHGLVSRKFGLTCDNLVSAHLVDANGNEMDANANEDSDLYWALRGGGGGNFGIVTEFTFTVHPVNQVILFSITWPDASYRTSTIRTWQSLVQSAPDELSILLHVNGGQGAISHIGCNGLFLPPDASGAPSLAALTKVLQPLLSLGNPSFVPHQISYLDAVTILAGDGDPNRVYFKGKSDYTLAPWPDPAIAAFLAAVKASPAPIATIFEAYGGAINRVGAADTAFPHRGATLFCLQYYLQWTSSASTSRNVAAIRGLYHAMRPYLPGYSYVNYLDADLPNYAQAYYKENLARLQTVKQQYDPDNFFQFAQSIPLPA